MESIEEIFKWREKVKQQNVLVVTSVYYHKFFCKFAALKECSVEFANYKKREQLLKTYNRFVIHGIKWFINTSEYRLP